MNDQTVIKRDPLLITILAVFGAILIAVVALLYFSLDQQKMTLALVQDQSNAQQQSMDQFKADLQGLGDQLKAQKQLSDTAFRDQAAAQAQKIASLQADIQTLKDAGKDWQKESLIALYKIEQKTDGNTDRMQRFRDELSGTVLPGLYREIQALKTGLGKLDARVPLSALSQDPSAISSPATTGAEPCWR